MKIVNQYNYYGPNRRNIMPVNEVAIDLDKEQLGILDASYPALCFKVDTLLELLSPENKHLVNMKDAASRGGTHGLALLIAETALFVQRCMGHSVKERGIVTTLTSADVQFYYEYDESSVASRVTDFCVDMFSMLLSNEHQANNLDAVFSMLSPKFNELITYGKPLTTPATTCAIIDAAKQRDIPWIRMERETFVVKHADFRLKKHSLISLGHGKNRVIIDSTFCVNRSEPYFPLIRDREQLIKKLATLNLPLPAQDAETTSRTSTMRIARSAERIGYPVTLKATTRTLGAATVTGINNRSELEVAAKKLLSIAPGVIAERHVEGNTYRLIIANKKLQAVFIKNTHATGTESKDLWRISNSQLHEDNLRIIQKAAEAFPVGIMEMYWVSRNISEPLGGDNGAIVDVNLAPDIDDIATIDPELHARIAEAFVDWIFPDPAAARIPIVTVTGTNGKTSTCRIIDAIFKQAGHNNGLTCTDGVYIGDKQVADGDYSGFPGHVIALNSPEVDAAILETARGGVIQMGVGYDRCDIGVCLNVTNDHLGEFGINHIEDMAEIKKGIISSATKAVVLNADCPHTLAMSTKISTDTKALVSLDKSAGELRLAHPEIAVFSVLEVRNDEPWVVLYDGDKSVDILAVKDMPVSLDGKALHYVCNAMHAVCACYFAGITVDTIRKTLTDFILSYENTPGRLNIYQSGGVTAIMDFAHNPESLRQLVELSQKFPTTGRRLIAISCSALSSDELIRETAMQAAGKFDHYVCKNFKESEHRSASEVPALLKEGLVAGGVDASKISTFEEPTQGIVALVDMAQEGDVVVMTTGRVHRDEHWKYLKEKF